MGHWSYAMPAGRAVILNARDRGSRRPVQTGAAAPIASRPRPPTVGGGAVLQFALTGLLVLVLFLVGSLLVFRSIGQNEALRDARQFAVLTGQGIVEPALRDGVLRGEPGASAGRPDRPGARARRASRPREDLDPRRAHRLLRRAAADRFEVPARRLEARGARTGAPRAELSNLAGPENRFEQGTAASTRSTFRFARRTGRLCCSRPTSAGASVASTGRRIWLPFAALLLVSLVLLWLVQVPLAWRLAIGFAAASWIARRSSCAPSRHRLTSGAASPPTSTTVSSRTSPASPTRSARRPTAPTRRCRPPSARPSRGGVRHTRQHATHPLASGRDPPAEPPRRRARSCARRPPVPARSARDRRSLDVADGLALNDETELLFYRAASEAIRNVERHARATDVSVNVGTPGRSGAPEVTDDGAGFTPARREQSRAEGHVGLSLLEELAARMGGTLEVRSAPGEGTSFVLEVPDA